MDWTIEFDKAIEQYLPDLEVLQDEPMSRHTTFRIGGPAKRMAFPSSREQLVLLMSFAKDYGANPLVIGNGSNLLVPDEGLDRLVIDTSANLNRVERGSGNTVLADAGATLARTADLACKSGLTGLEFAHGIPGTVGGRRLHERRGLRRRDEAGASIRGGAVPGGGYPGAFLRGTEFELPAQSADGASGGGGAVRGI